MPVEITTHRLVEGSENDSLMIHFYGVAPNEIPSTKSGESYQIWSLSHGNWEKKVQVKFGKAGPSGFDGLTPEVLLAVVLDRDFQRGLIPRVDDYEAKHRIQQALNVLRGQQSTVYVPPPPPPPEPEIEDEEEEEVIITKVIKKKGKKI